MLPRLLLLGTLLLRAVGRPTGSSEERWGSWGSFSGFGASLGGSFSSNVGTNIGIGLTDRGGAGGRDYGFNLFNGNNAAFSGNGHVNLGTYSGGHRHPVGFGNPGFGQPGFGRQLGFGEQPNFGQQPGFGQQPDNRQPQQPSIRGQVGVSNTGQNNNPEFGSSEIDTRSKEDIEGGAGIINPRNFDPLIVDSRESSEEDPNRKHFFDKIRDFLG